MIRTLHILGNIERSYLLLLGVAMPLKYAFDMPLAVKSWAWLMAFSSSLIALLVPCMSKYKWKIGFDSTSSWPPSFPSGLLSPIEN